MPAMPTLRTQKTNLRKLLLDLSKEDVQLNQIVSRCRLGSFGLSKLLQEAACQGSETESEGIFITQKEEQVQEAKVQGGNC